MGDLIERLRERARNARREGNCTAECDARLYEEAAAALEAAREDADRWRFVSEELSDSYGDGRTEPYECHIHLEWGQGSWIHDGSDEGRGRPDTFPGWNAIVDAKIAQHRLNYDDLDDIHDAAIDQARGKAGQEVGNG